ncbi:hypothetical protein [Arenicella xantha]|uniref:Uncharacterized protein n=1 Tax=Arenicella xantha TaxID=644221 RepID=A0A395JQ35_9GAMM|nr:hypothetical protein [Arenicella xantha]RBP53719.1 hypothetical protein DFR28_1011108 [Arenicella xantha]
MEILDLAQLIASNQASAKNELIKFLADPDQNDVDELILEFSYTEEGEGIDNMFELLGVDRSKALLKRQLDDDGGGLYSGAQYLLKQGVDINEVYDGVPIILQSVFNTEVPFSEYDQEPYEGDWSEEIEESDSLRVQLLKNGADLRLLEGEGYIYFINALSESEYGVCDAFFRAGYKLKTDGTVVNGEPFTSELQYILGDVYSDHAALGELYDEVLSDWSGINPLNQEGANQVNAYIEHYLNQKAETIDYLVKHGAIEHGLKLIDTDLPSVFARSRDYLERLPTWRLYGSRGFNLKALLEQHYPELGVQADMVDGEVLLAMLFDAREKRIRSALSSTEINQ